MELAVLRNLGQLRSQVRLLNLKKADFLLLGKVLGGQRSGTELEKLELNLARYTEFNRKGLYRYINEKRSVKGGVPLLANR